MAMAGFPTTKGAVDSTPYIPPLTSFACDFCISFSKVHVETAKYVSRLSLAVARG